MGSLLRYPCRGTTFVRIGNRWRRVLRRLPPADLPHASSVLTPATPAIRPVFRHFRTFDLTPSLQVTDISALLAAIGIPLRVTRYFLQEARSFLEEAPPFFQEAPGFSQEARGLLARSTGTSRKKHGDFLQEARGLLARSTGASRKKHGDFSQEARDFSQEARGLLARGPGASRKRPRGFSQETGGFSQETHGLLARGQVASRKRVGASHTMTVTAIGFGRNDDRGRRHLDFHSTNEPATDEHGGSSRAGTSVEGYCASGNGRFVRRRTPHAARHRRTSFLR